MKKGQILEGYIERVDFPNKGIVKVEGEEKTLIVKNAIPGQKVKASINKMRKGKAEGRLLEVLEPSADEVTSKILMKLSSWIWSILITGPYCWI